MGVEVSQRIEQTTVLAPQLRHALHLLAMGIPELRGEILRELAENPVLEEVSDGMGDTVVSADDSENRPDDTDRESDDERAFDDLGVAYVEGINRDTANPDDAERRERFFTNQRAEESLEQHLLHQIAVAEFSDDDRSLAELLVGELDRDGYFRGSLADIAEVTGSDGEHLHDILKRIGTLDPPGCGATNLAECLLPQLDAISDPFKRERVRQLLDHINDLAFVRAAEPEVLAALRTLNPRPGSLYRTSALENDIVRPEVQVVKRPGGGCLVLAEDRGLPMVRISQRYLDMLTDPDTDEATRAYVKERIASVKQLTDALEHRHETIVSIVQAIFDAQSEFFDGGMEALRPLTMVQVAEKVGVNHTTVSRTVRGKYVRTPHGVFELRRFFTSAVATESGEDASVATVMKRLKELINGEDLESPLSDELLSHRLKAMGYEVARRTVAKYRDRLGIPSAFKRAVRS